MLRFLTRPRWIIGHLVVMVAATLFIALGLWQLARLSERVSRNEQISARAAEPVVGIHAALASVPAGSDPGEELEHLTATASGAYDPTHEVLIRSRTLNGRPGFYVVTPLVGEDEAVLVNRGFISHEAGPAARFAPPVGVVTVEGRLRSSVDPPRIGPQDPPSGTLSQVFWLDIDRLQQQMPYRLAPVSIELAVQDPTQQSGLPIPLPEPVIDEGPHRGYAIQWFSFAVIAVVGYAFLIRNARRRVGTPQRSERALGRHPDSP